MAEATLKQKYCNAVKTYYGAAGHKKAERNEQVMRVYKYRLQAAKETVPTLEEAVAMGQFNGEGAV